MSVFARGARSIAPRRALLSDRRTYATPTQIPRPPPPTDKPPTETFSAPSKPKLCYTRPLPRDELPQIQVLPYIILMARILKRKKKPLRNDGRLFSHLPHSGCLDGPRSSS